MSSAANARELEVHELKLGELLVKEGLVTEAQLQEVLRSQDGHPEVHGLLGQMLVERQIVTREQLTSVLDRYQKRSRLGEVLVRTKAITLDQLEYALDYQKKTGIRLGDVLVRLSFVTEKEMKLALCAHLNIPFIDLDTLVVDRAVAGLVNAEFAQTHRIVPIDKIDNTVHVAMDDPTDRGVVKALEGMTGCSIEIVTSSRAAFQRTFVRVYGEEPEEVVIRGTRIEFLVDDRAEVLGEPKFGEDIRRADEMVRNLISLALRWRATDIHLEAVDAGVHTRLRIDGVLQDVNLGPLEEAIPRSYREIISRIKILGNMDIAERRRPQEGSFRAQLAEQSRLAKVNFRVSVIPGYFGENVVMRVLDPRRVPGSIQQLGFSKALTDRLLQLTRHTSGMILITGPTGCGKTSSLYALLMTLTRPEMRILTAEDPIEYVFDNLSQFEVNPKIGNTYAHYVKAFLHHDPEVIMLGEILDAETAEMAFRAAQTGHLILSTLHTIDAVGSVARLVDLKVSPNLIGSSVLGVISQRLVRTICAQCKEEYTPPDELLEEFFAVPPPGMRWYRGRGCAPCNFTGYKGQVAAGELWIPNDTDIFLINKRAPFEKIRVSSYRSTLFMADDAMDKLVRGLTNLEELGRRLTHDAITMFRNPVPAQRPTGTRVKRDQLESEVPW